MKLSETEILCVQRNRAKGKSFADIAERLSVDKKELKKYWMERQKFFSKPA